LVGKHDPKLPKHITQHQIYRGSSWTTFQKTKLVLKLFMILKKNPQIKIVHFLFAPTPFNTRILKNLISVFPIKVVQTVARIYEYNKQKMGSLLFADKIIVYSKYTANQLEGIEKKKIELIPPFIEYNDFPLTRKSEREKLRKKWSLEENDKVILFPGEYSRLDALDTLWKGFLLLKSKIPGLKLYLACRIKNREDQKEENRFKKIVSSLHLSSQVNFAGKVSHIRELYTVSDLVVFPVKSMEGKFDYPFVLLEALSCGVPVLTSDIAALPEIWDMDQDLLKNFTFPAGDPKLFASGALRLLKYGVKKDLNEYVQKRFSKDEVLKKYYNLYKNI
jgi:glycosyltransferase involved in cell wall biosynthesis